MQSRTLSRIGDSDSDPPPRAAFRAGSRCRPNVMFETTTPEVAVLLGETGRDYEVADELMRAGLCVYVCTSAQEVHALLRAGKNPVLLADSERAAAFDSYPLTRLVYVVPTRDASMNLAPETSPVEIQVLGAAANAELSPILHAMRRHLAITAPRIVEPPPDMPSPPLWRLSTPPRRLTSPEDRSLPLTLTEWQFISHLFRARGRTLTFAEWQALSAKDGIRQLHNVAVLVSRLRRKAQRHGVTLPLEAVRGVGYTFTQACGEPLPAADDTA